MMIDAKVKQSFIGVINNVEINDENVYNTTEYLLNTIHNEFGHNYNKQFTQDLSNTIFDLLSNEYLYINDIQTEFEQCIKNSTNATLNFYVFGYEGEIDKFNDNIKNHMYTPSLEKNVCHIEQKFIGEINNVQINNQDVFNTTKNILTCMDSKYGDIFNDKLTPDLVYTIEDLLKSEYNHIHEIEDSFITTINSQLSDNLEFYVGGTEGVIDIFNENLQNRQYYKYNYKYKDPFVIFCETETNTDNIELI